jgi:hypothetical protein
VICVQRNRGIRNISLVVPLLLLLLCSRSVVAQQTSHVGSFIQVTGGLGVSAHYDPTIINYINQLTLPAPDQKITDFASASEFFITPEVQVSDDWSVGIEYSYLLKSYNVLGQYAWNFSYTSQMPTMLVHYLSPGDGYWLKFGGGIGYAFGSFTEQFVQSGQENRSSTSGPAFKVEAVGNTEFDEHFWGSIGLDLRWVYAGTFKTVAVTSLASPKLDFFSAGIKFGVTFQL